MCLACQCSCVYAHLVDMSVGMGISHEVVHCVYVVIRVIVFVVNACNKTSRHAM